MSNRKLVIMVRDSSHVELDSFIYFPYFCWFQKLLVLLLVVVSFIRVRMSHEFWCEAVSAKWPKSREILRWRASTEHAESPPVVRSVIPFFLTSTVHSCSRRCLDEDPGNLASAELFPDYAELVVCAQNRTRIVVVLLSQSFFCCVWAAHSESRSQARYITLTQPPTLRHIEHILGSKQRSKVRFVKRCTLVINPAFSFAGTTFYVNGHFLGEISTFFDVAFFGDFAEAREKLISLESETPQDIALFLDIVHPGGKKKVTGTFVTFTLSTARV